MAYGDKQVDAPVRDLAKKLAKQDRFSDDALIQVGDAVYVPMWLIYVSRAEQLLAERQLFAK